MIVEFLQSAWNVVNGLLALIGLGQVVSWCYHRTPIGKQTGLNRETAKLFYNNRDLFVMTEYSYSIPAFLRAGPYHHQGMILRECASYAFTAPGFFPKRDCMEFIYFLSESRRLIEKTLNESQDGKCAEAYAQLSPRFNKLCGDLAALRLKYKGHCPDQFQQAYLPGLSSRTYDSDLARTR